MLWTAAAVASAHWPRSEMTLPSIVGLIESRARLAGGDACVARNHAALVNPR